MKVHDAVKIGVAAAMLAGAGVLLAGWLTHPSAGPQDVTCWLCTDSACAKEFTKGAVEIARLRQNTPDANPACPYCGKATTIRCVPCPHCGKFLKPAAHGQLPKTCPKCEKPTVETPPPPPVEAVKSAG